MEACAAPPKVIAKGRPQCDWLLRVRGLWVLLAAASTMLIGCHSMGGSSGGSAAWHEPLDYLAGLRGDYFRLESKRIGRGFHIYVRLPEGYGQEKDKRYPTVYVLDGDVLFPILAPSQLLLNYDARIPEAIVVGIAYGSFDPPINKRHFDFSGPAADARADEGGAPAFEAFLREELIPMIERRYRADPNRRVLFGQSRGGYMVLWSAFTDPDLFWGRIASNPVFSPGKERFMAEPERSARTDLGFVVTSSERDTPERRARMLEWFDAWTGRQPQSWALKTATIKDGTHSVDCVNSYRLGMLWLFDRAH
ncbi:MAG: alpha/beta hydrolase-fold protein [Pseudomonadota bacterium]|nr:alpha/beta hydrolase-fold protein [Pseudomonadota bacterium]